ncbi:hypothetical protein Bhyg_02863, partial [Pseudolycoriella hygida]
MKERIPDNANLNDYYGDLCSAPEKFYVLPGHKKMLLEIVEFVQNNILVKGYDFFNFKQKPSQVNNPMANELEVEKFDLNEQERLFRLVQTWMMKKTSSFYEKYSHAINVQMAEIKIVSNDEGNSSFELKSVETKLYAGIRVPYFEYKRHVKGQHIKNASTRTTRSSKKKATSTRRARQPQRRNSSSSDSEEVAENILIAKELEKNYLHESDYSVDDEAADAVMNEVVVASSSRTSSRQKTIVKENRGLKTAIKNLQENRAKQPIELFPALNDKLKSDDTIVLKSLFSSAQSNANRTKYGQRHNDIIKAFAGYMKMIGGSLAYSTLHANLALCWPSLSTVNEYIKDNKPVIIEARNAKEIQQHYDDTNNVISSNCYVQLAQPQSRSVPVDNYASDGDPRHS